MESLTEHRAETASSIIKPLAHPYRLMIIRILVDGQARSAHTLARVLGLSRAALFKHLYRLSECGLVSQDSTSRNTRFSIPTDHLAAMVAIVAALSPISELEGSIDLAAACIEGLDRNFSNSNNVTSTCVLPTARIVVRTAALYFVI